MDLALAAESSAPASKCRLGTQAHRDHRFNAQSRRKIVPTSRPGVPLAKRCVGINSTMLPRHRKLGTPRPKIGYARPCDFPAARLE